MTESTEFRAKGIIELEVDDASVKAAVREASKGTREEAERQTAGGRAPVRRGEDAGGGKIGDEVGKRVGNALSKYIGRIPGGGLVSGAVAESASGAIARYVGGGGGAIKSGVAEGLTQAAVGRAITGTGGKAASAATSIIKGAAIRGGGAAAVSGAAAGTGAGAGMAAGAVAALGGPVGIAAIAGVAALALAVKAPSIIRNAGNRRIDELLALPGAASSPDIARLALTRERGDIQRARRQGEIRSNSARFAQSQTEALSDDLNEVGARVGQILDYASGAGTWLFRNTTVVGLQLQMYAKLSGVTAPDPKALEQAYLNRVYRNVIADSQRNPI